MTRGHFLFVESNTTGTGAQAVERLIQDGIHVTFLARDRRLYPFLAGSRPHLSVLDLDTNDLDAVLAAVAAVRRGHAIDAVLTFSEFYVELVAEIAQRCGFRYLSPAAAHRCRNKFLTRTALRAAGLATPEFHLVASEQQARRVARAMTYPCVVKPTADSSSKGVLLVRDEAELMAHFVALHGCTVNSRGQRLGGEVLVEELLEGPEVSVETVTIGPDNTRVIGITQKHLSPPPRFIEIGHDVPALLGPEETEAVANAALDALKAVSFDLGPAHTEIRLTNSGPVVVEINPRLAGGMIPELVRHAFGVDLVAVLFTQIRGFAVDLTRTRREWASIRFLTADRCGRLMAVAGVAEARAVLGVREVAILKAPGTAVRPAEDAGDRIGYVIASGPERPQVMRAAEEALRALSLSFSPSSGR